MEHARLVDAMEALVRDLQATIVAALEAADGEGRFARDEWRRPGGGGGVTRVLAEGSPHREGRRQRVPGAGRGPAPHGGPAARATATPSRRWGSRSSSTRAAPASPTTHMNVRLLARGSKAWFGGGADLTPYYLFEEDAAHFHRELRGACERHRPGSYAEWKRTCDDYFFLPHRGEHRGVGGIFFEDLGGDPWRELSFVEDVGRTFPRAYLPIVEAARRPGLGRAGAGLAGDPARPLRGVQPAPRPGDGVRPRDGRAHRVDPHVAPAAGAVALRPPPGARQRGGAASPGDPHPPRLGVNGPDGPAIRLAAHPRLT